MRLHAWPLVLAVAVGAATALRSQTPLTTTPPPSQRSGDTAAAFTLKTLGGSADSLSNYRGRPVLINFWATWCPPCHDEMRMLVEAYRAHLPDSLVILAIDLTDQESSMKAVRDTVAEFQMVFPVLLDERGKVRRRYKLRGVPTSVFVGRDGVVRAVNIGPITSEALQQHLAEILQSHPQ